MAVSIMKQSGEDRRYLREYLADTIADVNTLPTNVVPGSICLVIETSDVYILNNQGEWKKL